MQSWPTVSVHTQRNSSVLLIKQPYLCYKRILPTLRQWHTIHALTAFFKIFGWPVKSLIDLQSTFTSHNLTSSFQKIKMKQSLKKKKNHLHTQCRSLFPSTSYPAREIRMASRPIVTHSHAPILHFLWSVLESVQEKHMHAKQHIHANTAHTLRLFHLLTFAKHAHRHE